MKIGNRIISVMLITVLSRVSGFAREITLASAYGATMYTDAYLVSTIIPSVLFTGVGMAVASVFISIYSAIIQKQGKEEALEFTNNLLNMILLVTVLVSTLALLFAKPLVGLFAVGFNEEALLLTLQFARILLPGIVLIGIAYVFTGYLEVNKKFEVPVFANIPGNLIIIAFIVLSTYSDIKLLAYGTQLGLLLQVMLLWYLAHRSGYSYRFTIKIKDKNIKSMFAMILPVFVGMTAQQLNVLIDKALASTLAAGSVSALNFADRLNSFVCGIFITSIVTVVYPAITELAVAENILVFKEYITKSINIMILLIVPLSAGAMSLCHPIVKLLFQRGSFDDSASLLTSGALFYYSIGMIGLGISSILTKAFYSLQDAKTPVIVSGITIAENIVLNFILIRYMGHRGLALATSISLLSGAAVLLYMINRRLGSFGWKNMVKSALKAGMASLAMFAGVRWAYGSICAELASYGSREIIALTSSILIGVLIYFLLSMVMKVQEVQQIIRLGRSMQ